MKLDPLWFSDIKIEPNVDLTQYLPIIEYNLVFQKMQNIVNRFGEISGINSENPSIENDCFIKINHWFKGKKMNFIINMTKSKCEMLKVSIFVPEKLTRSRKCTPDFFQKYFKHIMNIEDLE